MRRSSSRDGLLFRSNSATRLNRRLHSSNSLRPSEPDTTEDWGPGGTPERKSHTQKSHDSREVRHDSRDRPRIAGASTSTCMPKLPKQERVRNRGDSSGYAIAQRYSQSMSSGVLSKPSGANMTAGARRSLHPAVSDSFDILDEDTDINRNGSQIGISLAQSADRIKQWEQNKKAEQQRRAKLCPVVATRSKPSAVAGRGTGRVSGLLRRQGAGSVSKYRPAAPAASRPLTPASARSAATALLNRREPSPPATGQLRGNSGLKRRMEQARAARTQSVERKARGLLAGIPVAASGARFSGQTQRRQGTRESDSESESGASHSGTDSDGEARGDAGDHHAEGDAGGKKKKSRRRRRRARGRGRGATRAFGSGSGKSGASEASADAASRRQAQAKKHHAEFDMAVLGGGTDAGKDGSGGAVGSLGEDTEIGEGSPSIEPALIMSKNARRKRAARQRRRERAGREAAAAAAGDTGDDSNRRPESAGTSTDTTANGEDESKTRAMAASTPAPRRRAPRAAAAAATARLASTFEPSIHQCRDSSSTSRSSSSSLSTPQSAKPSASVEPSRRPRRAAASMASALLTATHADAPPARRAAGSASASVGPGSKAMHGSDRSDVDEDQESSSNNSSSSSDSDSDSDSDGSARSGRKRPRATVSSTKTNNSASKQPLRRSSRAKQSSRQKAAPSSGAGSSQRAAASSSSSASSSSARASRHSPEIRQPSIPAPLHAWRLTPPSTAEHRAAEARVEAALGIDRASSSSRGSLGKRKTRNPVPEPGQHSAETATLPSWVARWRHLSASDISSSLVSQQLSPFVLPPDAAHCRALGAAYSRRRLGSWRVLSGRAAWAAAAAARSRTEGASRANRRGLASALLQRETQSGALERERAKQRGLQLEPSPDALRRLARRPWGQLVMQQGKQMVDPSASASGTSSSAPSAAAAITSAAEMQPSASTTTADGKGISTNSTQARPSLEFHLASSAGLAHRRAVFDGTSCMWHKSSRIGASKRGVIATVKRAIAEEDEGGSSASAAAVRADASLGRSVSQWVDAMREQLAGNTDGPTGSVGLSGLSTAQLQRERKRRRVQLVRVATGLLHGTVDLGETEVDSMRRLQECAAIPGAPRVVVRDPTTVLLPLDDTNPVPDPERPPRAHALDNPRPAIRAAAESKAKRGHGRPGADENEGRTVAARRASARKAARKQAAQRNRASRAAAAAVPDLPLDDVELLPWEEEDRLVGAAAAAIAAEGMEQLRARHRARWPQWLRRLRDGEALLLEGVGSKKELLEAFGAWIAVQEGAVDVPPSLGFKAEPECRLPGRAAPSPPACLVVRGYVPGCDLRTGLSAAARRLADEHKGLAERAMQAAGSMHTMAADRAARALLAVLDAAAADQGGLVQSSITAALAGGGQSGMFTAMGGTNGAVLMAQQAAAGAFHGGRSVAAGDQDGSAHQLHDGEDLAREMQALGAIEEAAAASSLDAALDAAALSPAYFAHWQKWQGASPSTGSAAMESGSDSEAGTGIDADEEFGEDASSDVESDSGDDIAVRSAVPTLAGLLQGHGMANVAAASGHADFDSDDESDHENKKGGRKSRGKGRAQGPGRGGGSGVTWRGDAGLQLEAAQILHMNRLGAQAAGAQRGKASGTEDSHSEDEDDEEEKGFDLGDKSASSSSTGAGNGSVSDGDRSRQPIAQPQLCPWVHGDSSCTQGPRLLLIVHGIDAPALRAPATQRAIALLAAHPRVQVVATADHPEARQLLRRAAAQVERGAVGDPLPQDIRSLLAMRRMGKGAGSGYRGVPAWSVVRAPTYQPFSREELACHGAPLLAMGGALGWQGGEEGGPAGAQGTTAQSFGWVLRSLTHSHASLLVEISKGLEVQRKLAERLRKKRGGLTQARGRGEEDEQRPGMGLTSADLAQIVEAGGDSDSDSESESDSDASESSDSDSDEEGGRRNTRGAKSGSARGWRTHRVAKRAVKGTLHAPLAAPGLRFDALLRRCLDGMLADTDAQLRMLLTELRDHALVREVPRAVAVAQLEPGAALTGRIGGSSGGAGGGSGGQALLQLGLPDAAVRALAEGWDTEEVAKLLEGAGGGLGGNGGARAHGVTSDRGMAKRRGVGSAGGRGSSRRPSGGGSSSSFSGYGQKRGVSFGSTGAGRDLEDEEEDDGLGLDGVEDSDGDDEDHEDEDEGVGGGWMGAIASGQAAMEDVDIDEEFADWG